MDQKGMWQGLGVTIKIVDLTSEGRAFKSFDDKSSNVEGSRVAHADAAQASYKTDRRLVPCRVIMCTEEGVVSWLPQTQRIIALSACEAKCVPVADSTSEKIVAPLGLCYRVTRREKAPHMTIKGQFNWPSLSGRLNQRT